MKSHLLLRVLIIGATIMLGSDAAFACSCGPAPPVLDASDNMEKLRGKTRVYVNGRNSPQITQSEHLCNLWTDC